jgi:hypothetical protein
MIEKRHIGEGLISPITGLREAVVVGFLINSKRIMKK